MAERWKVMFGDWDGPKVVTNDEAECLVATLEPNEDGDVDAEIQKDALLIAAAPELLAALEQMAAFSVAGRDKAVGFAGMVKEWRILKRQARQAIAKARGGA